MRDFEEKFRDSMRLCTGIQTHRTFADQRLIILNAIGSMLMEIRASLKSARDNSFDLTLAELSHFSLSRNHKPRLDNVEGFFQGIIFFGVLANDYSTLVTEEHKNGTGQSNELLAILRAVCKPQYDQLSDHTVVSGFELRYQQCRQFNEAMANKQYLQALVILRQSNNIDTTEDHIIQLIHQQLDTAIQEQHYAEAFALLNHPIVFQDKIYYLALNTYRASNKTNLLQPIKLLLSIKEADRNLSVWNFLYELVLNCVQAVALNFSVHEQEKNLINLYGILKLCLDKTRDFMVDDPKRRQRYEAASHNITIQLRQYAQKTLDKNVTSEMIDAEVEKLKQFGHACLRGDNNISLATVIEEILAKSAYRAEESHVYHHYLPIINEDMPFAMFDLSKTETLTKLINQIWQETWLSYSVPLYLTAMKILAPHCKDAQEFLNQQRKILWELFSPQFISINILKAAAFSLHKNLKIFKVDSESVGKLVLENSLEYFDCTETITVLHQNDYILLSYLPRQIEEMVEAQTSASSLSSETPPVVVTDFFATRARTGTLEHPLNDAVESPLCAEGLAACSNRL